MECDSFKYSDSNLLKIAGFSFNVMWKSGLPSKSSEHSPEFNPGYGRGTYNRQCRYESPTISRAKIRFE